jgi:hypothetical protein
MTTTISEADSIEKRIRIAGAGDDTCDCAHWASVPFVGLDAGHWLTPERENSAESGGSQ